MSRRPTASIAEDEMLSGCQVHRFLVLHKELDADDGELTRTRKVRRRIIEEKFADLIAALYDGVRPRSTPRPKSPTRTAARARSRPRWKSATPGARVGAEDGGGMTDRRSDSRAPSPPGALALAGLVLSRRFGARLPEPGAPRRDHRRLRDPAKCSAGPG
jgi:hypothetical protein